MVTVSILVVDDEPFVCENLKLKLKRLGHREVQYEVTPCGHGNQALEMTFRQDFHIVFTDIRMPFYGGLSLIQALRGRGYTGTIWVLSGYDDFDTVRSAFLSGADDYLLKPIDLEQLNQKLQAYLAARKETAAAPPPPESGGGAAPGDTIAFAEEYIQRHFRDSNLDMAEVAAHVALSYSHFSSLFRTKTKVTFPAYLLNLRVQEAVRLLRDPSLKIAEICYLSGFKYPQQFSRDFKKSTGLYPTEYQQTLLSGNPEPGKGGG